MNQAGETDHRPETLGEIAQRFDNERSVLESRLKLLTQGEAVFISALNRRSLEGGDPVLFEVAHDLGTSHLQGDALTPVFVEKPDLASLRLDELFPDSVPQSDLFFLVSGVNLKKEGDATEEPQAITKPVTKRRGRKKTSPSVIHAGKEDHSETQASFLKYQSVVTLRGADDLWMISNGGRYLNVEILRALLFDIKTGSSLTPQKFKSLINNQLCRLKKDGITSKKQPNGIHNGRYLDESFVISLLSNIDTNRSPTKIRERVTLEKFENIKTNLSTKRKRTRQHIASDE